MSPVRRLDSRVLVLAAIALFSGLLYSGVTKAFFCSYDDFEELHRAAFEDAREPARIFTTSHFGSHRYRPLNRATNDLTYSLSGLKGWPFRARNLAFHVANLVLLYALARRLFPSSPRVAIVGTALFAVHPLVNQTLVGAVVTNSIAYAFVFAACLLCLDGARVFAFRPWRLMLGVVLGWLGVLTYEPAVVVFPLIVLLLFLRARAAPGTVDRRVVRILAPTTLLFGVAYWVLRLLFVRSGFGKAASNLPTAGRLARDLMLYGVALVSPVDPVLANRLAGVPYPSQLLREGAWLRVAVLGLALLALASLWAGHRWLKRRSPRAAALDSAGALFLALGIIVQLAPVLLFATHASETYLYLPAAFASVLWAYLAARLAAAAGIGGRRAITAAVGLLLGLYAAATVARNASVVRCAQTAERILASVPCPDRRIEDPTVRLASAAGAEPSVRYGFYGFRGTDTIGDGGHANSALTSALQLACADSRIRGEVLPPPGLREACGAPTSAGATAGAYWVDADGGLTPCAAAAH